jgi:predicted NUDIX family NTP pyrophosphohydrolase
VFTLELDRAGCTNADTQCGHSPLPAHGRGARGAAGASWRTLLRAGAWTIPKGEIQSGEDSLAAAKREFREETGFSLEEARSFVVLGTFRQSGQKLVEVWAVEGDADPSRLVSNTFVLEWPPRSGRLRDFPEIDRAAWFMFAEAARKIIKGQAQVLEALETHLCGRAGAS